jgi:hypothetical protein
VERDAATTGGRDIELRRLLLTENDGETGTIDVLMS